MSDYTKKQDLKKIKAERLREAREAAGFGSMKKAAEAIGVSPATYASHEQMRRELSLPYAELYAKAFKTSVMHLQAWDEAIIRDAEIADRVAKDMGSGSKLHETIRRATRPAPNASFPPTYQKFSGDHSVPLLGQSSAGPNGRFIMNGAEIGRVFCPPMLEGVEGAYAVRVYGTSMEPRFMPGETVWLNPHEPVRAMDDVVAQILVEGEELPESYIKRFKSQSAKTLRLWQHNPDEGEEHDLEFDSADVFSVHKVVFHAMI